MGRGRKRRAAEVVERSNSLAVNPGRYEHLQDAPRANGNVPAAPDYLDDYGMDKWHELVADLTSMGVMSSECREIMISYCTAYSGWRRTMEMVAKSGIAIIDRDANGKVTIRRNALTSEMRMYRQAMDKLLPEFGLTPSARSRLVSMRREIQSDPFESLLSRLSGNN